MAISDNTSYELTGAQVKDLASKVKNSVGGADRLDNLIYMVELTLNEGSEIAAQINDPDVYGALVAQTCGYGFLRAKDGVWLDRLSVGTAISGYDRFIFLDSSFEYTGSGTCCRSIVGYAANWDDNEEDCYPTFYLRNDTKGTAFGGSNFTRIDLGANPNTGLSDWYHPEETDWSYEANYIIQPMTITEAEEIASKINASQQTYYVTSSQVRNAMQYVVRSTSTGKLLSSYNSVKNALTRSNINTVYLPGIATKQNKTTMVYAGGASNSAHFILKDELDESSVSIMLKNPSAYSDSNSVMWYVFEKDLLTESRDVYGYYDNTDWDPTTTPEDMYQVTYDSSDNLYMSVGNSSASDWKKINNDAIVAFTGTDGTAAGTAGLVPAPATTDAGKFLKADGTWATVSGGGPTVVQTTGQSTTDVMSQKAVTDIIGDVETILQTLNSGNGAQQ